MMLLLNMLLSLMVTLTYMQNKKLYFSLLKALLLDQIWLRVCINVDILIMPSRQLLWLAKVIAHNKCCHNLRYAKTTLSSYSTLIVVMSIIYFYQYPESVEGAVPGIYSVSYPTTVIIITHAHAILLLELWPLQVLSLILFASKCGPALSLIEWSLTLIIICMRPGTFKLENMIFPYMPTNYWRCLIIST